MKYNKLYHMVAALLVVMLLVLTACSSDAHGRKLLIKLL